MHIYPRNYLSVYVIPDFSGSNTFTPKLACIPRLHFIICLKSGKVMLLLFFKKILEHLMIFISIIFFLYLFVKHLPSVGADVFYF